jgi:arginine/lysine/ornithine decarboxylase
VSEPVRFDRTGPIAAERVRPADAAGRRAAAMVVPYPPGIPVLYPGELIAPETAAYLAELAEAGARFHGTPDGRLSAIEVWPESASEPER